MSPSLYLRIRIRQWKFGLLLSWFGIIGSMLATWISGSLFYLIPLIASALMHTGCAFVFKHWTDRLRDRAEFIHGCRRKDLVIRRLVP